MAHRDHEGKRVKTRFALISHLNERDRALFKPVCGFYETGRHCTRGSKCPFRHEMPKNSNSHRRSGLDDPVMVELVAKASDMGPLKPPTDTSIKTLYIRLLNSSVLEQDLRDHFCPYGEIESIKFFEHRRGGTCAFLTYATRQAAEKAMLELSSWTDINSQRLKLLWGPDQDTCNRTLAHSNLLLQQQIISTQEVGGSSSTDNNGASS